MSEVKRYGHIGYLVHATEQLQELYRDMKVYVLASDFDSTVHDFNTVVRQKISISKERDTALSQLAALREERDQLIDAQIRKNSEWAALREEAEQFREWRNEKNLEILASVEDANNQFAENEKLKQRLADAERRNAELQKARDAQQLLALVRLSDLHDNNGEFEKLYNLLRNCYPFVRARCEATDFGDASARTTLEMIDAAFKRIELKPTESGASE